MKSPHFTVVSNASEGSTRRLAWQLEQVRSATAALWSWARADLNKPLSVIVAKDENSLRALAPQYWEGRRSVRPASIWVTGPDNHYLAIRADVEVDHSGTVNPYVTAYYWYVDLVLAQSIDRDLPLWFRSGFAGVLSNTSSGTITSCSARRFRGSSRSCGSARCCRCRSCSTVTHRSPEVIEADRREVFDAETWAFVHFLMFGDERKRAEKLDAYAKLVSGGTDAAAAFAETLGPVEALEGPFRVYFQGSHLHAIAESTSTSASSASVSRCARCRRRSPPRSALPFTRP